MTSPLQFSDQLFAPPPPPGMDVIRIGHGNIYINNKKPATAISLAKTCKPTSWGFNEAYKNAKRLDNLKGYDAFRPRKNDPNTSKAVKKDMWDAKDCITIVKENNEILTHMMVKGSKDVPPYRLGHDRVINVVVYKKPSIPVPVAHINIHPNPINFFNNTERPPLVKEHIKHSKKLDEVIRALKALGYTTIITGDVNITLGKSRSRDYPTTYSVAKDNGLNVWSTEVDAIFWDKEVFRPVKKDIIPGRLTGSDHPWFWFDFKVA